jgi:glycosyltransferase involved in cell wall biosynthesis
MKIDLRERRDTPVWVTSPEIPESYYRATLPARMTGGTICNSFRASFDGEAAKDVGLSRAFFSELPFCETLTLYGMGTPTVMPSGVTSSIPTRFLDAIRSVPGFLFDLDDPPLPKTIDPQAEADELTRLTVHGIVTGETRRVSDFSGVDLGPLVCDIQQTFTGPNGLPTPEQLLVLHDRIRAMAGSLRDHAQDGADKPSALLRISEIIAATVPLADAVLAVAPQLKVRLAPNAIDPMEFQHSRKPKDGIVRIGYCSSWSHRPDGALVMPALRECARIPNVEVWFFGWHPGWSHDLVIERPKVLEFDGLTYHHGGTFTDTREFFRASSVLDVALAPLQDTLHNRCRGSSKWFESAMYRTPMVLSDMPPYACVEHGVTGFKARTAEEFTEYALMLCKDAELRKRIGGAAYDAVMARHTVTSCADVWRAAVATPFLA